MCSALDSDGVPYAAHVAEDDIPILPKPDELLALHGVTADLFGILRDWFDVPPMVTIDLREVDSAVAELGDHVMIAAMAMRKLQALHLLSTPGVMTTTDVVVSIISDLDRALIQAPNMHLKRAAESTDWDAELAGLEIDIDDVAEAEPPSRSDHPSLATAHPGAQVGEDRGSAETGDDDPNGEDPNGGDSIGEDSAADDISDADGALDIRASELVQSLIDMGMIQDISEIDVDDLDLAFDDPDDFDDDDSDEDDSWLVIEYVDSDDPDAQIEHFRALHSMLHEAVRGVLEASQGEIRYFV